MHFDVIDITLILIKLHTHINNWQEREMKLQKKVFIIIIVVVVIVNVVDLVHYWMIEWMFNIVTWATLEMRTLILVVIVVVGNIVTAIDISHYFSYFIVWFHYWVSILCSSDDGSNFLIKWHILYVVCFTMVNKK